jgi:hypothetical protein
MIYTTLEAIRQHHPCRERWAVLLRALGKTRADDEPVALATVLERNGLDDALWCLRTVPEEHARWRRLAVAYARDVQHLMSEPRSLAALDLAERHAAGAATDDELAAASAAARAAARDAAWAAASAAAWAAARDAAWAAAGAARAAAGAAVWDAAVQRQTVLLREALDA